MKITTPILILTPFCYAQEQTPCWGFICVEEIRKIFYCTPKKIRLTATSYSRLGCQKVDIFCSEKGHVFLINGNKSNEGTYLKFRQFILTNKLPMEKNIRLWVSMKTYK